MHSFYGPGSSMEKLFLFGADSLIDSLVTNSAEEWTFETNYGPSTLLFLIKGRQHHSRQCPCSVATDPRTVSTLHFREHHYFERHLRMENK